MISGSQQCDAYVFGTESCTELLAKFRLQTRPIHMCTYNAGQPRQETQGLYLTDGESWSVNNLFFHLMGDSNLFDEQGTFRYHIYPLAALS